jgi:cell division protein ZapA
VTKAFCFLQIDCALNNPIHCIFTTNKKSKMNPSVPITLKICNRQYRIKVEPENEEVVRKIYGGMLEKINTFRELFKGRDDQDIMAMVLIDHLTSSAALPDASQNPTSEMLSEIESIHTLLHT